MPKFDDIQHEIRNLFDAIEDMEPEEVEAQLPALMQYADELATQEARKTDAICMAFRREESLVEHLKGEEARIRARRQAKERALEQFRTWIKDVFQRNGLQKIKGEISTLFLRKTETVEFTGNPQDLPQDLRTLKVDIAPDKKAIKEALIALREVPGARLVERYSVSMR